MPVAKSAGRGLHPRPERSTPAKYLLGFSLSTFYCRCSKSSSLPVVKESGPALPVGNNAGRGLNPRPERSTPAKYSPTLPNSSPPSPYKSSYFCPLSSALAWVDHSGRGFNPRPAQGRNAPPLLVAWGTTPDRHKVGTLPLCWLRNADYQIPVRSIGQDLLLPVGNRAGRGLHPRPERSTPAKSPPTLPNSSSSPLPNPSHFRSSLLCSCVDGSFRSGVQPPTGTDPTGTDPTGSRSSAQKRQPPPSPASAKPPPSAIIPPIPFQPSRIFR